MIRFFDPQLLTISHIYLTNALAGISIFLILIHIIEYIAKYIPYFSYQLGQPKLEPTYNWTVTTFTFIYFISLIIYNLIQNNHAPHKTRLKFFQLGVLIFALLFFISINFLFPSSKYYYSVWALDQKNGDITWERICFESKKDDVHPENSNATPTPSTNDSSIVAYFGSIGLVCLDLNGKIKWKNSKIPHETIYGVAASPILHKNSIFINTTVDKKTFVYSINSVNGSINWRVRGPEIKGSSGINRPPIVITTNSSDQLISWGSSSLIGFDLNDGSKLWDYDINLKQTDHVASMTYKSGQLILMGLDKTMAISINDLGAPSLPVIWITEAKGGNVTSPVVSENLLYLLSDNGKVTCISLISFC